MMFKQYYCKFFVFAIAISLFGYKKVKAQADFSTSCDVVDVGLVIDSSENLGPKNFESIRGFLNTFFKVINVGLSSTRIAAVQFASEATTLWSLSESVNSADLVQGISEMEYFGGEQNITSAFTHLASDIFTTENGDRSTVPDVIVIFTGGATTESNEGVEELRSLGAHVIVVAVGEKVDLKWTKFASTPAEDNFFSLESAFYVVLQLQDPDNVLCTETETTGPETTMVISTSTERIVSSTFTEQIPTTNQERASTQPITVPEVAPTTTTEEALLFPIDLLLSSFANLSSLSCHQGSWTPWYNNDTPEGEGDDESLQSIRSRYPGAVCEFPSDFQARVASTGLAIDSNSNNVFASRLTGLECLNIFGPPGCEDYEIRFCCPQKIPTPLPSVTSTSSSGIRKITTTSATPPLPPASTTTQQQTTTPVAKPSPYCPSGGWTSWYNNDSPAGNGDDETLRSIRSRYPGDVCDYPTEFEARVSGTKVGLDSSSDNVIASRLNGLECLNGRGRNCKDYEIRFCCPRRIRCFVGSTSTTSEGTNENVKELKCSAGDVCADVTATVVTDEGKNVTRINSFGLCMSASKCSKFQCDSARSLFSSNVIDVLSCEAKCCEEDLCNRPKNIFPSPTPGRIEGAYNRGTMCYKGVVVHGILNPRKLGFNNLGLRLVECELGQVCSTVEATAHFPGTGGSGFIVRQSQCLAPVACDPSKCNFMKSILPKKRGLKLVNCSAQCCDWRGCNAPPVTSASQSSSVSKTSATKKPSTNKLNSLIGKTAFTQSLTSITQNPLTSKASTFKKLFPKFDDEFLPSCSISKAVRSMLWCESLFSQPQPYNGLETCRNKLKETARCVAKQMRWCTTGNKFNKLDSFNFGSFNTQTILNFLNEAGWSDEYSTLNEEINNFCFHAGYNFSFRKPVTTRVDGCNFQFLTELRDKAKSFYFTFTWAEEKEDICRAQLRFKQWLIDATTSKCGFDRLLKQGYSPIAAHYLDGLVRVALREIKSYESLACTGVPKIVG